MRCEDCPVNPGKSCVAERAPIFVGLYCLNWAPHGTEQERRMIRERSDLPYDEPGPSAATIAATPPAEVGTPGLLTRAANFGKAIVSHVAAGMPEADEATVERRRETCRSCELFDAERVTCRVCGCFLDIKIRWNDQVCPVGKW